MAGGGSETSLETNRCLCTTQRVHFRAPPSSSGTQSFFPSTWSLSDAQGMVQGTRGSMHAGARIRPHRLPLHPHIPCTHSVRHPTAMHPTGLRGAMGLPDQRLRWLAEGLGVTSPPTVGTRLSPGPGKRLFSHCLPAGTNIDCLNGCSAQGTGPFRAELHTGRGKPRGLFNN